MTFKGTAYGFSKEQLDKQKSKYDMGVEKQVVNFINSVGVGKVNGGGPDKLHNELKNGVLLCHLANKIQGNVISDKIIKKFVGNSNFDRQRIAAFNKAAKSLGLKVSDSFEAPDLVDNNNMTAVLIGLYAYGRKCKEKGKKWGIIAKPNTGTRME